MPKCQFVNLWSEKINNSLLKSLIHHINVFNVLNLKHCTQLFVFHFLLVCFSNPKYWNAKWQNLRGMIDRINIWVWSIVTSSCLKSTFRANFRCTAGVVIVKVSSHLWSCFQTSLRTFDLYFYFFDYKPDYVAKFCFALVNKLFACTHHWTIPNFHANSTKKIRAKISGTGIKEMYQFISYRFCISLGRVNICEFFNFWVQSVVDGYVASKGNLNIFGVWGTSIGKSDHANPNSYFNTCNCQTC